MKIKSQKALNELEADVVVRFHTKQRGKSNG